MPDKRIENINVHSENRLITPAELKEEYPLTEKVVATILNGQTTIKKILQREDPRLFAVVGPCSVHDVRAALEYAQKLRTLAEEVADSLFLVMRVYFEKPRTKIGWQGLINDPHLDQTYKIADGLHLARKLLLDIGHLGLPVAGEALDLVSPQYIQDMFSWTAIGARTTESQSHRKMASGLSSAVGFKNSTDGNLTVAINAMHSAANPQHFLSVDPAGSVAVVRTKGNPFTHIVLRGGKHGPNFDAEHIEQCETELRQAELLANIMIDCSHANSGKEPSVQLQVLQNVADQIERGNHSIVGFMLESNLNYGKQAIPPDLTNLQYGVSITDACLDWERTAEGLRNLRARLRPVLQKRAL